MFCSTHTAANEATNVASVNTTDSNCPQANTGLFIGHLLGNTDSTSAGSVLYWCLH